MRIIIATILMLMFLQPQLHVQALATSPVDFIVTEALAHKLSRVTAAGVRSEIFSFAGTTRPAGLAIDSAGDYIVTEQDANKLSRVTPGGARTEILSFAGGTVLAGVAIDWAGNYIVAEHGFNKLSKVTPAGVRTVIYSFDVDTRPIGVAIDSAGNYIVAEHGLNKLSKVTAGGVRTEIYSFGGGIGPAGVAIDSAGNYIVTEQIANKLSKVTAGGVRTEIYSFGGGTIPVGVAIDSAGDYIVAEYGPNKLSKVTPGGVRTVIFSFVGNTGPVSVAIVPTVPSDTAAPTTTIELSGTLGNNEWYTSDAAVTLNAVDNEGGLGVKETKYSFDSVNWNTYLNPFVVSTEGTQTIYYYSTDNAENIETTNSQTIKIDKTPPVITVNTPSNSGVYVLNVAVASDYACTDVTSGPTSCVGPVPSGANIDTATVGGRSFTVNAEDAAGNAATLTVSYSVQYASGGLCLGEPSHVVLQPINADGSSIFKQGRTVPVKFRVCDVNGNSIGAPGVVVSFKLVRVVSGTSSQTVNEDVTSTTPDTAFRWDPSAQQWIFNISTKNLQAGYTCYYEITLNDGTKIQFSFGLR